MWIHRKNLLCCQLEAPWESKSYLPEKVSTELAFSEFTRTNEISDRFATSPNGCQFFVSQLKRNAPFTWPAGETPESLVHLYQYPLAPLLSPLSLLKVVPSWREPSPSSMALPATRIQNRKWRTPEKMEFSRGEALWDNNQLEHMPKFRQRSAISRTQSISCSSMTLQWRSHTKEMQRPPCRAG